MTQTGRMGLYAYLREIIGWGEIIAIVHGISFVASAATFVTFGIRYGWELNLRTGIAGGITLTLLLIALFRGDAGSSSSGGYFIGGDTSPSCD